MNEARILDDLVRLFDHYRQQFDLGSKPTAHLSALADLTDEQLLDNLPGVLNRLVEHVHTILAGLPE